EGKIAATVIGMLGYGPEAEEVGQDVFVRFFRSIDGFRGDSSLGTYLTRIAINLCLNTLQKRKRRQIFRFFQRDEASPEMQIPDHGLSQEQRETQAMVQRALQAMEPDFRAVVVLRMLEGYSTKETAQMLNIPTGTVLSRLARGQKKLKEIIQQLDKAA
ncbi:MAG: RNA polymerase sigma factor, partial [Bacteroidota bacterium]